MILYLRIKSGSGILNLFYQTRHVLEEEIVEVLLLHVLQLEDGLVASLVGHDEVRMLGTD